MAETSTIFGFIKYVSATDILSDFKKTVDSHFVNSLKRCVYISFCILKNCLKQRIKFLRFPSYNAYTLSALWATSFE